MTYFADDCEDLRLCDDCERVLEDHEESLCEKCQQRKEAFDWIDQTETAVRELTAKYGWEIENIHFSRDTRSRYITLWKADCETIVVRISDHQSMYEKENFSLSMDGRDHSIEQLQSRLQRS